MHKKKKRPIKQGRDLLRQVPHRSIGGVNLPGNEFTAEWESPNERTTIHTLWLCHDVKNIKTQEITITYLDDEGIERKYTPDIVFNKNSDLIFCEVKPLRYLLRKDTRNMLKAVNRELVKDNIKFHYLTEDQLKNTCIAKNIEKIIGYKSQQISEQTILDIRTAINNNEITIKQLLERQNTSITLLNIYASIAQKHLCINWDAELNENSIVSLPSNENRGLQYEEVSNSGRYGSILQKLVLGSGEEAERVLAVTKSEEQQIKTYNPIGFF